MPWFGSRRRQQAADPPPTPAPKPHTQIIDGRRYMVDATYILPKDLGEINRLDFQHYMLRTFLRGNYAAPINRPSAMLDVGSGTGRWAIQMAQEFPQANVFSLDIEPPQEQNSVVLESQPENCIFVPGDVLKGLPFPDGSFDFVHQRLLVGAIPENSWPAVARELARVTRRGGWVELVEATPVPNGGPALEQLRQWLTTATQMRGIYLNVGLYIGQLLDMAGLGNISFYELPVPIGNYGGRLGNMAEAHYDSLLMSFRPILISRGIAAEATFDATLRAAHDEIAHGRYISPYHLAYGQRR